MLRMIGEFTDVTILSIRTSDVIGKIIAPIVQPDGLSIEAFYVKPLRENGEKILLTKDIREIGLGSLIVDSEDNLMDLEDLVRLQELARLNYKVVGKQVVTELKRKVGKVSDFAVDDLSWKVQKVYAGKSIIRDLTSAGRVIDRQQILEVNDKKIVVKDVEEKLPKAAINHPATAQEPA